MFKNRYTAMKHAAAAAVLSGSVAAHAALPAVATTALGDVSTAVTDTIAGIWPIVASVVVGFGIISMFKKGVSKAI